MLREPDRYNALRTWMDVHDGVMTTSVLRHLGFTKREIDGLVKRGELVRIRRGVYRGRGVRWDLRAQLQAATVAHGAEARLVLISALHWQGLLFRAASSPQIGVPGDHGVRQLPGRTVYRTRFARSRAIEHDGVRCSAIDDAIPHLAGQVRGQHAMRRILRRAVREAVRRDARVAEQLSVVAARRFPGVVELRDVLRTLPGATQIRSDLEEDFIVFCEIWGLPPFQMNQKVGGVERDAVRVAERLIVELDTRGYHANLIAIESDRQRRRRATVAGWRHVEITGRDLSDEPRRVAEDLASLLGLPGWEPPVDATRRWAAVVHSARGIWLPNRTARVSRPA